MLSAHSEDNHKEHQEMMNDGGDFGWISGFGGLGMLVGPLLWVALIVLAILAVTR